MKLSLISRVWFEPKGRKWLLRIVGAFALYTLAGFILLPILIKWQLAKQIPPITHRVVTVRQVKCNPYTFSLTVRGLDLTETNHQPFISFEELYANFQLSSLFRLAWTFDEISLKEPRAEIVLDKDGRFNFANLFASTNAAPPPKAPGKSTIPRLLIFNLVITNGHVGFADLSRKSPFRTAYEPIDFHLTRFTTRPGEQSPYQFEASSYGGCRVAWSGTVTAQPTGSSGALQITGVPLPKHGPYLEDFTRAQLTDGKLDVAGSYGFAFGTNGLDLTISNFTTTVSDLQLKDPDTGEAVLALSRCELRDGSFNWRARQGRVGSVAVIEPKVLARRRADGTINLAALMVSRGTPSSAVSTNVPATNAVSGPLWNFTLDDCRLENGSVQLEDGTVSGPFRTTLKPVTLRLEHFSNVPQSEAALQVQVTTEAEEILRLATRCSIDPIKIAGSLELKAIELKKYQPYLAPFFRGQLTAGKTDVALEFSGRHGANAEEVTVTNAVVRVSDLMVRSPDGSEEVMKAPAFAIEHASASLADRAVHINAIRSTGMAINARRETNGAINLMGLLASTNQSTAVGTNAAPPTAAPAWRAALDELALQDYHIHFEDRQLPKPGSLDLDKLALTLRGVQFPSNSPVQVEFSAQVNTSGAISAHGAVSPYAPAADAELQVAGLELRGFQPWIDPHIKLRINSGALSTKGWVKYASPGGPGPLFHFDGELGVTNFVAIEQVLFKELVRWDELAVKGINLDWQTNNTVIEQIRFAGLKSSVIIGADRRPTFLSLLSSGSSVGSDTNSAAPVRSTASSPPFPLQLGELKFENAAIHFNDQSIQPPCVFDLQQFSGTIKGLSTKPGATATVDVVGRVDEASPFALRGSLHPLASDLSFKLALTSSNLQLTPFTTYLEKYGGHPLNKGRLSLDLDYALQQNALKAQNRVRIDQLMLGPRNNNPDAAKLPLKLAVALLKDNNGRIELDLPVAGRLDDPQFSIAPIILKVVVNLIVKAATSPFKLLGALVGGGEEMSYIDFAPGQALLSQAETNKLDKLIQALEKRPALNLEIEGSMDAVADRDALARGLVKDQMQSQRLQELAGIGQAPASTETFQIDPVDYERLLRATMAKTYGTNLTEAMRLLATRAANTNVVAAPRPAVRDPGFFKRLGSVFKARKERLATSQAHRQAKEDALLRKQNPELATLTADDMEVLLAAKTEVPPEALRQLMLDRAKAVQAYLLASGKVSAERLFLIAPKTPDASFKGEARVNLALN